VPAHLAVIDPATRTPELACFNRMSRRSRIPLTYHLPALYGLESLRAANDSLVGIVIFGSAASVNDATPWIAALEDWLRPRVNRGTPTLGICFGHQLLAKVLGGRVADLFPAKRQGLRDIHLTANALWGDPCSGPVLVSHRQGVVELPEVLQIVGSSDEVHVEAFAHRTLPIWGFQSHPEATVDFAVNNSVPFDHPHSVLTFGHGLVDAFLDRVAAT
jgi:GMP synthase-like glutamine amidotransferase